LFDYQGEENKIIGPGCSPELLSSEKCPSGGLELRFTWKKYGEHSVQADVEATRTAGAAFREEDTGGYRINLLIDSQAELLLMSR